MINHLATVLTFFGIGQKAPEVYAPEPELAHEHTWAATFWLPADIEARIPGAVLEPAGAEGEAFGQFLARVGRILYAERVRWKGAQVVVSGPGFKPRPLSRHEKRLAVAWARRVAR